MTDKKTGFTKRILSDKKGFTLSEVLVGLQLMSLLAILAFTVFKLFQLSYVKQLNELNKIREESFEHYRHYLEQNKNQNPMTEPRSNIGK